MDKNKKQEQKQPSAFPLRFKNKDLKRASGVLAELQDKSLTQLINELLEREVQNDDIARQILAGAGR
jgi:predicted HicB family RNase H-like nuclease